jgi:hypothetical protein
MVTRRARLTGREALGLAAAAELAARLPHAAAAVWIVGANRDAMITGARKLTMLLLDAAGELPGTCADARLALRTRVACCPECHDGDMLTEEELPGGERAVVCCILAARAYRSPA